jgi:G3E family GTPase
MLHHEEEAGETSHHDDEQDETLHHGEEDDHQEKEHETEEEHSYYSGDLSGEDHHAEADTTKEITSLLVFYRNPMGAVALPRFSSEITALNGKQIMIEGFSIPLEVEGKIFVLSAQPSNMCFFCNSA